ncbi:MAG: hypothetical protein IJK54_05765 [Clostridia bacterium]|nr:hypothetical protein [Clostridia bacterium]
MSCTAGRIRIGAGGDSRCSNCAVLEKPTSSSRASAPYENRLEKNKKPIETLED